MIGRILQTERRAGVGSSQGAGVVRATTRIRRALVWRTRNKPVFLEYEGCGCGKIRSGKS